MPPRSFTKLDITVETASDKWKRAFPRMKKKIEQAVAVAFMHAKKPVAFQRRHFEISVLLTDDATIKLLNRDYRDKNKATNVLSFPQLNMQKFRKTALDIYPAKTAVPLGDIVLAQETIARETRMQGKTLESHTLHLVVHGLLHLLGYDHIREKDAKAMEKLECDILEILGYPDPYHDTAPQKVRGS